MARSTDIFKLTVGIWIHLSNASSIKKKKTPRSRKEFTSSLRKELKNGKGSNEEKMNKKPEFLTDASVSL